MVGALEGLDVAELFTQTNGVIGAGQADQLAVQQAR